jgi:hypothetical protein
MELISSIAIFPQQLLNFCLDDFALRIWRASGNLVFKVVESLREQGQELGCLSSKYIFCLKSR